MPPLYLYNNKLLVVNSALAAAQDCCCSSQDCPNYLRITWTAIGWSGNNSSGTAQGFQSASVSIPTSGGGGRPFSSISVSFFSSTTSSGTYTADNNCVRRFSVYCRSGPSVQTGKTEDADALPNYISTGYGTSYWGSGRQWFGGTNFQNYPNWTNIMQSNQTTLGRSDGGSGYPRRTSASHAGSRQTWDFLKTQTSSSTIVDFGVGPNQSTNPWEATLTISKYP